MGDPAGDEAERLEPLRLAQLVLDLLPLGDVEDEDEHGRATQVLDGAGQLLHLPDAAGKHDPVGDGPDGPGDLRRGLACGGAHLREIVGVDPFAGPVGALAHELLRGHPGQLGHERVGVGDPSVLDDEDAGQRALGHLAELVLGVVTGGDVVEDADHSGGGPGRGRLEGEGDLRPEGRSVLPDPSSLQGARLDLAVPDLPGRLDVGGTVLRVDDVRPSHPRQVGGAVAGDLAVTLVHLEEAPLVVHREDAHRCPLEGGAPAGLALAQGAGEVDGALPGSPVLDRGGGEAGEQEGDEGHDPELDEGRALPDPGQVGLTSGELEGPGLLVHRKGHREGELGRHLASRLAVEEQVLPVGPGPVEHLQPDLLEVLLQDVPHEVVHAERGADPARQRFPACFPVSGDLSSRVDREDDDHAGLDVGPGLLDEGDPPRRRHLAPVARELHRGPPGRLGEGVGPEGAEVRPREGLDVEDGRVLVAGPLRANAVVGKPFFPDGPLVRGEPSGRDPEKEGGGLELVVGLPGMDRADVAPELLPGDLVGCREEPGRAAQDLVVGLEPLRDLGLDAAGVDLEVLLHGAALGGGEGAPPVEEERRRDQEHRDRQEADPATPAWTQGQSGHRPPRATEPHPWMMARSRGRREP